MVPRNELTALVAVALDIPLSAAIFSINSDLVIFCYLVEAVNVPVLLPAPALQELFDMLMLNHNL